MRGVRGVHVLDVYATGNFNGIQFKWVVECKAWKSNVPKEKVLALTSIVQDVGADRGFLLSEVGFQSGAIKVTQNSNITLTSIEELTHSTEQFRSEMLIAKKGMEIKKAKSRIRELKRASEANKYHPERVMLFGELAISEHLLEEAMHDKFPIAYPTKGLVFSDLDELAAYIDKIVGLANTWKANEN